MQREEENTPFILITSSVIHLNMESCSPEPKYLQRDRMAAGGTHFSASTTKQRRSQIKIQVRGNVERLAAY